MARPVPQLRQTDSVLRKARFAARFAGSLRQRHKYLRFVEGEFDHATWKAQGHMMRALAGVVRRYPRHTTRVLQFLGRRTRAEHFAKAVRPQVGSDERTYSSGARGYVPLVLRKMIRSGRGNEVLRFVRSKYRESDSAGRELFLRSLEPLAEPRHKEYADALLRTAKYFLHQAPTAQHLEWVRLGVRASTHANGTVAIDFFKSAYEYAPPEDRQHIHNRLLELAGTSAAARVMEAASQLAHEKDNWTRARMAFLLNAVIVHARQWDDGELALRALDEQRRIQLLGRKGERQRRHQGRWKVRNDRKDHDLGT